MLFPKRGVEIIDEFLGIAKYAELANGSDDERRLLTKAIAQQLRFELGPGWGVKSQSLDHPQSKDSLAFSLQQSGFLVWDWQNGETRKRQITEVTPGLEVTDQHFMPVDPLDLLGVGTVVKPLEVELGEVFTLIRRIAQDQTWIITALKTLLGSQTQIHWILETLVLEGRVILGPFGNPRVVLSKKQD